MCIRDSYPEGLQNLLHFDALPFGGQTATPDGCCALRLTLTVPARGEAAATLLLSCGPVSYTHLGAEKAL